MWIGLELFYGVYVDLSSCRPIGWGPGPIPWTAVDQYARRYGIVGEQFDDLVYYIRAMDLAYLAHYDKKNKAARKKI